MNEPPNYTEPPEEKICDNCHHSSLDYHFQLYCSEYQRRVNVRGKCDSWIEL